MAGHMNVTESPSRIWLSTIDSAQQLEILHLEVVGRMWILFLPHHHWNTTVNIVKDKTLVPKRENTEKT